MKIARLRLPPRKRQGSLRASLGWLVEPFDLQLAKGTQRGEVENRVHEQLEALPPQVIMVDDVHYLLRRTVGGFESITSVLNIIQACSDVHFWVVSLHRPAWRYVEGVSSSVHLFRDHIQLCELGPEQLSETLLARTEAAGLEARFDDLVNRRTAGDDEVKARKRATAAYWRILAETSLGNPQVALQFWLSSLGPLNGSGNEDDGRLPGDTGANGKRPIRVHNFLGPSKEEVEKMSDDYLFVLTALVVHDGLGLEDLADVLNVPGKQLAVTCQHLESLGMLERTRRTYSISPRWQPVVLRCLDQRNFAHR